MKDKRFIIAILVLGVFVVLAILATTVFTLRKTELNWTTTTLVYDTEQNDEILASAEFNMNQSIFFVEKETYVKNIEEAYPYIAVESVETVFPNKLVVHVSERQAVFALTLDDSTYYLLDDTLKVLEQTTSVDFSSNVSAVLLHVENTSLEESDIVVGKTLTKLKEYDSISLLGNSLSRMNLDNLSQRAWMSSVELEQGTTRVTLTIATDWGLVLQLENAENNFFEKLYKAYSLFVTYHDANPPQNQGTILAYDTTSGVVEVSFLPVQD